MPHVIIGTAGHVDHGKTALVKALTGVDTDRLQEEKRRGLTIELGFAPLDLGDGLMAGIVDVPGHEKFIRHMLAGAGGIDLALLVVDAGEGVMPQTAEHLDILTLLGVREGLVAVTKTDLVDPGWLELVTEEIRARLAGSFLEGKPILPVSARTGAGLPALKEQLRRLAGGAAPRPAWGPFRLPVDRVFTMEGFGTVVTGTVTGGSVRVEDPVELIPSGLTAKVRGLQVYGRPVERASAGLRAALNLAGIPKSALRRGEVAAAPGSLPAAGVLDVGLQCLPGGRSIRTGSQVHFYHGAGAALARVALLDRDVLRPGERCFAQLRLAGPMGVRAGDRFVVRFLSPLETIGGGVVLDAAPAKHRRHDPAVLARLAVRAGGSDGQRLLQALEDAGLSLPTLEELSASLGLDPAEGAGMLTALLGSGGGVELLPGRFLASTVLDVLWARCRALLEQFHAANPLLPGLDRAALAQRLCPALPPAASGALLGLFVREGRLKMEAGCCALPDFTVRLTRRQAALQAELAGIYQAAGLEPPSAEAALARLPPQARREGRLLLWRLGAGGRLVLLAPGIFCDGEAYGGALRALGRWFGSHEAITLAQYRDLLGVSRKYALLLLEHFDRRKITIKAGDIRRAGPGLPEPCHPPEDVV